MNNLKERVDAGEVVWSSDKKRSMYRRDDGVYIVMTVFTRDYRGKVWEYALEAWKK